MAENPPAPTPAPAPAVAAATVDTIGNPRDVQGIIGLGVVGGSFAIAAVAIVTGANAANILSMFLPLAATIVGFYFGQKSQQ
jgi:hypothetical protein